MKKKNTELLSFIPVSLRETLGQQTVNDLKGIAKWLELSLNARLRKGEIVDCLYHYFLDDPVLWLRRLPLHDIRLLRSLVASGKNCSVEVYNFFGISTLEDLFLVDGDFSVQEDLKMQFVISNELQQALQGIDWDCILSDPGQIRKYEVERYMYGLLNLFGLLRLEDILATVYELLDHKISVEEILDIFEKSLGLRNLVYMHPDFKPENGVWLHSFYMDDPDEILLKQCENIDTMETAAFSKEKIAAAGEMPWMNFSQWISSDLRYWMMEKMHYTEEEMRSVLLYLWFSNQYDCNLSSLLATVVNARLNTAEDMKETLETLIRFLNETPKWILLGNSSEEIARQEEMARQPYVAQHKVGRNDPCPCGSGRKYKQCCGKKN